MCTERPQESPVTQRHCNGAVIPAEPLMVKKNQIKSPRSDGECVKASSIPGQT